jgi:hypothetical protein
MSLQDHHVSSRSLIFSIVNQQVRLVGTPLYRQRSHMCCTRRWRPIFASTHFWHARWDPKKSTMTKPTKTGPSEIDPENVQEIEALKERKDDIWGLHIFNQKELFQCSSRTNRPLRRLMTQQWELHHLFRTKMLEKKPKILLLLCLWFKHMKYSPMPKIKHF